MGAEFLSARINCTMSEILDHPDASQAESIIFPKDLPWANNYEGGNLLVAQVSKFDCGGIAISVCLSHKIGDGTSVLNFVNDWSRMTYSPMTKTVAPKFVGDSVFSANNFSPIIAPQMLSNDSECVQKRIIFHKTKLDALRAKVAAESGVENPTRAEVVSAILFRCAIKAASSTTTSMRPSKFVHLLNVRSMLKSRLPQSTIGNILSSFSTTATKEEDIELPTLVRNLRKGVEEAYKKDHVEQNEYILEVVESMRKGKKTYDDDEYKDVYFCSNLCKFPLYKVDFGWGKPERVSLPNGPFKNFFFFEEIERRKTAEDALNMMRCQWQNISTVLSQAGLTLPSPSDVIGDMQLDNASIEQLYQEVVVSRFVAEAIGKGQARAEAELAAESVLESKNQEISRLRDRLRYYEAVNHEMSQRNQEIIEVARKQRQRKKSRRSGYGVV